jgi:catechol 2,3-dioxygenase-like lactoylglutathione lyase family enzyme
MKVMEIDHATIMTAKLDETRAFFEDVLGLKIGPRPDFDMPVCWLYAGGRDIVHLVAAGSPQAPSQRGSINHFALRIADFEQAIADLKAKGVPFETESTPGGELKQIYITDPNGVRIELNCPGPGSHTGA